MNKFFRKVTLISGAACGLFLISCQDEGAVTAIQPTGKNAGIAQAPPLMIPEFKLSKAGNETLIYNADGRIKQVNGTADPLYTGYNTYRIDYEYSGNLINATYYKDNVKEKKMEWTIENARAAALTKTDYQTDGVTVLSTMHLGYQYNNQNQLIEVTLLEKDKKTITISYDNLGNVVKFLTVSNTKKGTEFINMWKYEYTEYVGGPLEVDKGATLPMHVFGKNTLGWIGDPYLPIFGKFGKNRVKKSIRTNYPATYRYAYDLDANGYVKEQKTLTNSGVFVESKQLTYSIPVKSRL